MENKEGICPEKEGLTAILLLSDGETWDILANCTVSIVTNKQLKQLRLGIEEPHQLVDVLDIGFLCSYV